MSGVEVVHMKFLEVINVSIWQGLKSKNNSEVF